MRQPYRRINKFEVSPTIDTSIYAAGDALSTAVITLGSAVSPGSGNSGAFAESTCSGILRKLEVIDLDNEKGILDFHFFKASITGAAANAAFSLSDADALHWLGTVNIVAADYKNVSSTSTSNAFAQSQPNLYMKSDSALLYVYVTIGATGTPTYTATTDLKFRFYIESD